MPSWREDIAGDVDPAHTVDKYFDTRLDEAQKAAVTTEYIARVNAVLEPYGLVLHPDGEITGHSQTEATWRAIGDAVDGIKLLDVSEDVLGV